MARHAASVRMSVQVSQATNGVSRRHSRRPTIAHQEAGGTKGCRTGADSWIWRPERYMSSRPRARTCSSTLAGTCRDAVRV